MGLLTKLQDLTAALQSILTDVPLVMTALQDLETFLDGTP